MLILTNDETKKPIFNENRFFYITYLFLCFILGCLIHPFIKHLIPVIPRYKKQDLYCDLIYSPCYIDLVILDICIIYQIIMINIFNECTR